MAGRKLTPSLSSSWPCWKDPWSKPSIKQTHNCKLRDWHCAAHLCPAVLCSAMLCSHWWASGSSWGQGMEHTPGQQHRVGDPTALRGSCGKCHRCHQESGFLCFHRISALFATMQRLQAEFKWCAHISLPNDHKYWHGYWKHSFMPLFFHFHTQSTCWLVAVFRMMQCVSGAARKNILCSLLSCHDWYRL